MLDEVSGWWIALAAGGLMLSMVGGYLLATYVTKGRK